MSLETNYFADFNVVVKSLELILTDVFSLSKLENLLLEGWAFDWLSKKLECVATCQSADEILAYFMKLLSISFLSLSFFKVVVRHIAVSIRVRLKLFDRLESESKTSDSLGANRSTLDFVFLAKNFLPFQHNGVDWASNQSRFGKDAVDTWHLQSPDDELDS